MGGPFETHGKCLVCGSKALSEKKTFERDFLVICQNCTFVFSNCKATQEELTAYYQQYPRGAALSPITRLRYLEVCSHLEKYRKTNNILDVGCGDGHFLTVAREKGWNVYGSEYTDTAVALNEAKGIAMSKGRLKEIAFDREFFDVITSFEVLEHVDDPRDEARSIHAALRSGGCAYVTTPNFNSVSRWMFGPGWNIICYPEHLGYFTTRTLKLLFEDAGLRLESVTTTGLSLDRFRSAIRGKGSTPLSGMDEAFRQNAERSEPLKFAKHVVNGILNLMSAGDTLKAEFQKP